MSEERLQAIESALAHQDEQIRDLSAVIARQWNDIERLKRLLEQAQATIEEMNDAPGANVRPPHY
jgi:uncharacterized coiled-coil protein SlyX